MTDIDATDPNNLARIVMLVYGSKQDGKGNYWCYVAVKPTEYQRFAELHKARKINVYDFEKEGFGEIVVSGQGVRPPSEVTYQVAQIYNIDVKDLFGETNPEDVMSKKIQQLKSQTEQ